MNLKNWIWKSSFLGCLARRCYSLLWIKIGHLPDETVLRRVVPKVQRKEDTGEIKSSFYKNSSGVSSDIVLFSSLEDTIRGHKNPPRWPDYVGYAEYTVGELRRLSTACPSTKPALDVQHDPIKDPKPEKNYSHASTQRRLTDGEINQIQAKYVFEADLPSHLWPRPS